METKNDIRKRIRKTNKSLSSDFKEIASRAIFKEIETLEIFNSSKNILVYYSLNDEVSTIAFINKWKISKNLYLPKVVGDYLDIIKFDNSTPLNKGSYDIMEPEGTPCSLKDIDLIIVPAVAISRKGKRIGRGKGYYDKLLQNSSQVKIGVIYDHQLCQDFEDEPHDIRMNYVITQNEIIKI